MNPWTDLLLLTAIVVWSVDLSGWTDTSLGWLSRWLGRTVRSFKPFSCSLCMTWWTGIVYLVVTGRFCIPLVAYVALLAFLAFPLSEIFIFIRETLLKWINTK
jgi:hypothetical protein